MRKWAFRVSRVILESGRQTEFVQRATRESVGKVRPSFARAQLGVATNFVDNCRDEARGTSSHAALPDGRAILHARASRA